jgi:hypothetical protein
MSGPDVVATVLLVLSVVGVLAACLGAGRTSGPLDGQHFASAAAPVPPVVVGAGVRGGVGVASAAALTLLTVATVVVTSGAIATAFGRAMTGEFGPQHPSRDENEAES